MSNKKQDSRTIKIALTGDAGVGKSSILNQYIDQRFDSEYLTTIGVDMQIKSFNHRDQPVMMHIWDTAGQERFSAITSSYLRNIEAIVIVFSLDHRQSFANIQKWIDIVKKENINSDQLVYVIVGNKCDLPSYQIDINDNEVNDYVESLKKTNHNVIYVKVSAKKNINLSDIFVHIIEHRFKCDKENGNYVLKIDNNILVAVNDSMIDKKCPFCIIL